MAWDLFMELFKAFLRFEQLIYLNEFIYYLR